MQNNILQILHKDHEEVSKMIQQLEQSTGGNQQLYNKLNSELLAHSKAEEATFYKPLEEHKSAKSLVEEGIKEHKEIETALKKLGGMLSGSGMKSGVKELKETVEHHVEEEESEIFDAARENFSQDLLNQIGQQFQQQKEKMMASMPGSAMR